MSFTEEYSPDEDRDLEELASYPTAFGITFTPRVLGIALGIAGLLGSLYLVMNWLLPAYQSLQQMEADRSGKEQQVQQQKNGVSAGEFQKVETQLRQQEILKRQILSLFGNEKTLNTLLLDISQIFRARNVSLVSFQPQGTSPTVIADGSLGAGVNNKLKHQGFNIQLKGRYADTQSVLRDLERLQPLIFIKNLSTQADGGNPVVRVVSVGKNQAKVVPGDDQPVTTNFLLDTVVPLSAEEVAKLAPPPPPPGSPPPAGQPAPAPK